jgi:hypothetical protein
LAVKTCKYCRTEQPEESFEVCRVFKGVVYRRLRCRRCKRARTNERRTALRQWLDDYKKTLCCVRGGFANYRALEFHHPGLGDKEMNVADMIRSGLSRASIKLEIAKCIVLCSNCHQIEHYGDQK